MINSIEIYYDGLHIEKYKYNLQIKGFTTNCSILSTSKHNSYRDFYENISDSLNNRPLSLQIWEDNIEKAIQQVKDIHSINSSIFVKIPIINTSGEYNTNVLNYAINNKIPINITAIYTIEQINIGAKLIEGTDSPVIISIFGGPISDTAIDPEPYIKHSKELFKNRKNTKILWAGCREIYTVVRAQNMGCDIITIPDGVIEKLEHINIELFKLSEERVQKYRKDAIKGKKSIL